MALGTDVRAGRSALRRPAPARGEAAPRLRDHQGARGAVRAAPTRPAPARSIPTLQLLEDLGYARVIPGEEGKKVYEITDAGRAHLVENQATVDYIFDRISKLVGHFLDEPMSEIHVAFRDVGRATYRLASEAVGKPEVLKQVSEILKRAAKEIQDIPR